MICVLKINFIAGPPGTVGVAPLPPAEVFIPAGIAADGVFVSEIYESLMYLAGAVNPVCSQFRRITAYDGTRHIATLATGVAGWTSAANDTDSVTVTVNGGATYLHRLRREIPLFPIDVGAVANIPLTQGGDQANAAYKVTLINPGTGYAIGVTGAVSTLRLDILAVGPNGEITSFVIANPGTGLLVGQFLTIPGGGANATVRVDGIGFGVNVNGAGSGLGPPSQLTAVIGERNRFTGQIFYIPALQQNGAAVGTANTDPSAAQQFLPQSNTRVSIFPPPSYTNDSTASSVIFGDFVDAINNTRFLVIEPFTQVFPVAGFEFNILKFTEDHVVPYNYTGSQVSQSQSVCYQLTLEAITLPNLSISAPGLGGKIAFYPYLYVEFSNVSSATGPSNNILYSNNPASTKTFI